jgi:RimJ/RimL family protein N-acetyltransferase
VITLLAVQTHDIEYFSKWWRDLNLIKVTSGITSPLSDSQVKKYFKNILEPQAALHFMIDCDNRTIGHVSLQQRNDNWWETQIVIGDNADQGRGYGSEALHLLIDKARQQGINRIYLEVRPDNAKAIGAYRKVGFSIVGNLIKTNNPRQPELIRMELIS